MIRIVLFYIAANRWRFESLRTANRDARLILSSEISIAFEKWISRNSLKKHFSPGEFEGAGSLKISQKLSGNDTRNDFVFEGTKVELGHGDERIDNL